MPILKKKKEKKKRVDTLITILSAGGCLNRDLLQMSSDAKHIAKKEEKLSKSYLKGSRRNRNPYSLSINCISMDCLFTIVTNHTSSEIFQALLLLVLMNTANKNPLI